MTAPGPNPTSDPGAHHHHGHHEASVHLDEADWEAWAAQTELEGEVFLSFVTDTAAWVTELRDAQAPPVQRILDIGSGPGVGTCELARRFLNAQVIAVDGSPAMLDRATRRAADQGLTERVTTHLAEVPDGLDGLAGADLIWASMALHHVGDEVMALRTLRDLLAPDGLIAIAEVADPMRMLPAELDVGGPGLVDRLDHAGAAWFAAMRQGLDGSVPSADLPTMLASAGFDVVGTRVAREHLDPPLSGDARRVAVGSVERLRDHLQGYLDDDDLRALDVLRDADDPRSVGHRADVFLTASRQIVIARAGQPDA